LDSQGIYKITNLINGKFYIGSTVDLDKRWKNHKRALNKEVHHSSLLQYDWNFYGKDVFVFEIIEEVLNKSFLIGLESYYFGVLRPEYNMCPPFKSRFGIKHSDETKRKIGLKSLGRRHSIETKKKISETHKGIKLSDEHRQKLSKSHIGKRPSQETLKKLRESHLGNKSALGNKWSEEAKKKLSEIRKERFKNKENHPVYGKPRSEETKQKLRIINLRKKRPLI